MKKSSVLLINLPSQSVRQPEEHCGIAMLDAYLTSKNIKSEILDSYALNYSIDETKKQILKWVEENSSYRCIIGLSLFVTNHHSFVEICKYVKSVFADIEIVAGGHYASLNKELLMKKYNFLDAIIVGEGEQTLYNFVTSAKDVEVKGVFCRNYKYVPAERIINLDALPFQSRYLTVEQLKGQPFSIHTSRGCYGECAFCSISSFYNIHSKQIRQTFRSAESVASEIKLLVKKYGIKNIKIVDDNFFRGNNNAFLYELVDLLKCTDVSFRLSARPNDITIERGRLLKELNVKVIAIGVETTHEESLKLFNKGIQLNDSLNAIAILNSNNITCLANFIMFTPVIDVEGLKKNLDFIKNYATKCLFHRINSHLWIRATDPIVDALFKMGLCEKVGFPYLKCKYNSSSVYEIKKLFDIWCEPTMNLYYENVDVLMALGIENNVSQFQMYLKMINEDIGVLYHLIDLAEQNVLHEEGEKFIREKLVEVGYSEREK